MTTKRPRLEQTIAEHLTVYHGVEQGWAHEAAAANHCASVADYHRELHNPDYYEFIDQAPPTHSVEEVWTA
jgi:hypothetical protein